MKLNGVACGEKLSKFETNQARLKKGHNESSEVLTKTITKTKNGLARCVIKESKCVVNLKKTII